MRAIYLFAVLAISAANLHAQCKDTLVGDEPVVTEVMNKDGSSLALRVTRCETEVSLKSGNTTKVLLTLEGGSGHSSFADLNDDGLHEIDIVFGCGVVNCSHTIYAVEPMTYKPRKLVSFSGSGLEKIGGYFFTSSRQGAGEYWAEGYKISDFSRLEVESIPSFHVCNCYDKPTSQQVCRIPVASKERRSAFARQIIKAFCIPGTKVQYGWRP